MAIAELSRRFRLLVGAEPSPAAWSLSTLAGQITELSGERGAPLLTMAVHLLHEAQQTGGLAAWVSGADSTFYPPDVAAWGIDLDALVVVRLPEPRRIARAADHLVRSGAFMLVVLDLGETDVPLPMQTRLQGLAGKHGAAILCLTKKHESKPSLGSLVSLRAQAVRKPAGKGHFACELKVIKDKRRGPGWSHAEVCRGPEGLR